MQRSLTAAAFTLLSLACAAPAQPANPPQAPGTDLLGDPLPDGAVARFGSARWRHAWLSSFVPLADGQTVVTAGRDGFVRSWDLSGRLKRMVRLQGDTPPLWAVALSPDGRTVAALVQGRQQIRLWDAGSGKELASLPAPKAGVGYLCFAPDGKTLAVGQGNWQLAFWDVATRQGRTVDLPRRPRPLVQFNRDSTFHGQFSPDGKWFVAGASWQEPLGVFEVATGREVHRIDDAARTSAVSPDSQRLAVSSIRTGKGKRGEVLRLFELASGKPLEQFALDGDPSFYALAFAPAGDVLACAFSDSSCLLDLRTGQVRHRLTGRPLTPAFSGDGKTLFASTGSRIRLWDVATGRERDEQAGDFGYNPVLAVSPDGRLLASGDWMEQTVSLWDTADGRLRQRLPLQGKGRYVRSLAFSADGRTLAAAQGMGFVQLWDVATGQVRRTATLRDPEHKETDGDYFFNLHLALDGDRVTVSALNQLFGPAGVVTRLAHWDVSDGKPWGGRMVPGEQRQAVWLDGGTAVILSSLPDLQKPDVHTLELVDVPTGVTRRQLAGSAGDELLGASPDGRLVVGHRPGGASTAEASDRITVWEAVTATAAVSLPAGRVIQLALAPDNRSAVTVEGDDLRVRDLTTGAVRLRRTLPGAPGSSAGQALVRALVLTPDGRRAITALADGTALAWDLPPAPRPAGPAPGAAQIAAWWADLADADAARAQRAVWALADAPTPAVAFLRARLSPAVPPDAGQVARWIADLGSDDFVTRRDAHDGLARLGPLVEPAVRAALKDKLRPEARRRLDQLLQAMRGEPSREELQQIRALETLELIGPPARELLQALARGAPAARQTREARAVLDRLTRRAAAAD